MELTGFAEHLPSGLKGGDCSCQGLMQVFPGQVEGRRWDRLAEAGKGQDLGSSVLDKLTFTMHVNYPAGDGEGLGSLVELGVSGYEWNCCWTERAHQGMSIDRESKQGLSGEPFQH